eukprot:TRINITY_DN3260_c0_g1_i1.p1 TRINITY_DN3260_c0_g1~~TRINITY_DN3260_c0_g1_i1.p1  ORF type:complete len:145 (+),score=16.79 TRINITY_DN3260_c0_g1_i1:643-1077(+)
MKISLVCICSDPDYEEDNLIVFCDGCNIPVHQKCYGIPKIPRGNWFCNRCQSTQKDIECIFCPNTDGAVKPVLGGGWAHILCALWIPEISIQDSLYMEPIINKVNRDRLNLTCVLCGIPKGACIQCKERNCFVSFHVTCARTLR